MKVFLIYSLCTFSQASIVTVIHLVNAVVDTVSNEGIVVTCVLGVCGTVAVARAVCFCLSQCCEWSFVGVRG